MTPRTRATSSAASAALILLASTAGAQTVRPVDMSKLNDPASFDFMAPVLKDVEIVSLGESIHLTSEFPRVRVGVIRFLNDRLGFGLVAMEGSAEDLWVGQDRLLSSARRDGDVTTALGSLFPIWNTNDVRELLALEVQSWTTPHPLYVAAYDIQPGTSKDSPGQSIFSQLADRLATYAPAPAGVNAGSLVADLGPLAHACAGYTRADSTRVERGIAAVAAWAEAAAPAVDAKFTNVPHGAVLRLIPANLRASHRLCLDRLGQGWGRYKSVRDTNAAQYAVALKKVAPAEKLILWAHLSHVFHNSEGYGVSVGQILHRDLGPRLYTIMPFAEGGTATLIYSDVNEDISYGRVHGGESLLGAHLSKLSNTDYFLDLRSVADDSLLATRHPIMVEAEPMSLALAKDFDGILWIKRVHPPRWAGMGMPLVFTGLTVMHYRVVALWTLAAVVALLVWLVVRRMRRRRPAVRG